MIKFRDEEDLVRSFVRPGSKDLGVAKVIRLMPYEDDKETEKFKDCMVEATEQEAAVKLFNLIKSEGPCMVEILPMQEQKVVYNNGDAIELRQKVRYKRIYKCENCPNMSMESFNGGICNKFLEYVHITDGCPFGSESIPAEQEKKVYQCTTCSKNSYGTSCLNAYTDKAISCDEYIPENRKDKK